MPGVRRHARERNQRVFTTETRSSEYLLIKNSLLRALRSSAVKSLLGIRASIWFFAPPQFQGCISLLKKVSSPRLWVFYGSARSSICPRFGSLGKFRLRVTDLPAVPFRGNGDSTTGKVDVRFPHFRFTGPGFHARYFST